ncbi:MAG: hypothetical protein ACRDQZ_06330 [Mycobacteriales bacterium]
MNNPEPRKIHLVGTIPAESDEKAMAWALKQTNNGELLCTLPSGETGARKNWLIPIVESMRDHPALEIRTEGAWSHYKDLLSFKIRKGHTLRADSLNFGYADHTLKVWDAFKKAREAVNKHGMAYQVSIPGDLDMAMFTLGPIGPMRHREAFTQRTVHEIESIYSSFGTEAIFQIEVPVELVFTTKAPGPLQGLVAKRLAKGISRIAERSPSGARFGVHLCLGDMNNRALGQMRDVRPLVAMNNAIAERWPLGRSLEFIHAPLAAADSPPPTERAWYSPLRGLRLPHQTRFVAGLAHESPAVSDIEQAETLATVEDLIGRRVDIAAACGFGRRELPAAEEVMRRSRFLVDQP